MKHLLADLCRSYRNGRIDRRTFLEGIALATQSASVILAMGAILEPGPAAANLAGKPDPVQDTNENLDETVPEKSSEALGRGLADEASLDSELPILTFIGESVFNAVGAGAEPDALKTVRLALSSKVYTLKAVITIEQEVRAAQQLSKTASFLGKANWAVISYMFGSKTLTVYKAKSKSLNITDSARQAVKEGFFYANPLLAGTAIEALGAFGASYNRALFEMMKDRPPEDQILPWGP